PSSSARSGYRKSMLTAVDAAFFSQWAWSIRTSSRCERARSSHARPVVEARCNIGGAWLAQAGGRAKRVADPPPEPVGIDPGGLAETLEGEGGVAIAALDPGQVASEGAGTPIASREQTAQAILEDREPQLQLPGQRPATQPDGHATAARLVWRLSATPPQLSHPCISIWGYLGPLHTVPEDEYGSEPGRLPRVP